MLRDAPDAPTVDSTDREVHTRAPACQHETHPLQLMVPVQLSVRHAEPVLTLLVSIQESYPAALDPPLK